MSELKTFCYEASSRIMMGLAQELNVMPGQHYQPAGHNASRVLSLRLVGLNPHYLKSVKSLRSELTMWAGLPDKKPVRIGQDGQSITVEIPKPGRFWQQVTLGRLPLRRGLVATLGLGLRDEPRRLNFAEPSTAHTFIVGQTRSGKTNAQRLIGWNLAHNTTPDEARLIIFDVAKKGYRWNDFGNLACLAHPLIIDIAEADRVLCWLSQEIDRRAGRQVTGPRLFILVDELKALADESKVATTYLSRIASVGGEFGLHLVLSTQYPQIQMLGSAELKRNITTRLCGKVDDAGAAANALGLADTGAEALQGYGDFLLKDFNGLCRLTVAHLQPKDIVPLARAGETATLDLPDADSINGGPRFMTEPDPLEPDHVALALFEPMAIGKLAHALGIGKTKATRVKRFAERIRAWAVEHGHSNYCFVSNDFIEL